MNNPKADLEAIMDLLEEWRRENGADYVTMSTDGTGVAWDRVNGIYRYDILREYKSTEKTETPGAATPRESK